jgi:phthalate 4,5-cis-dihydrodiol dehydrogenase
MLPTFFSDPRVEIVAGFDTREEPLRQLASDFGAATHRDVEALCSDPKVEVVYVASPHQFHAQHVELAARHGKHVLLEKPMALTLAQCDAMIVACERANVQLIVGHCHSFDAPYKSARDLVDSGEYGAVRMIHALNYTDFLYRPRRPEELNTQEGGGVVFSQAAHQLDIVRMLAGSPVIRVRAATGRWDEARPTEGAYVAMVWFANGCFASVTYSGYAHFDSDEWCGWTSEMGGAKPPERHSQARQRLVQIGTAADEAELKAATTYGGPKYLDVRAEMSPRAYQHFGPVIVSCERADIRPVPDGVWIHSDRERRKIVLPPSTVPRAEVIDELYGALRQNVKPQHSGIWARGTLAACLALLQSGASQADVVL